VSSHRTVEPPAEPVKKTAEHRRGDAAFAVGVVAAVGVLAWIVITMQGLSHDLRSANAARDALAQQVQGLGASPVAGPPGSRGEPGPAVVGPSGPAGSPGAAGRAGTSASPVPGPSGPAGRAGSPGADSTVPGPTGAAGAPGADSTVPGPKGDQGVAGVDGAPGKDGTDGAPGKDGTNGSPPAGWTYTDPSGVAYTCSPAAGFDPTAPRYTCTADAAATPTPSGSPTSSGILGVGMLAATAAYRRL